MIKNRTNLYSYFSNCISCLLLSIGLCILINTSFISELNIIEIMIQVFITGIVMTILLFNRWTLVLGTILGIVGIIYCLSSLGIEKTEDFISFYNWLIALMPQNSHWYSLETIALIHKLLNIGICILLFLVGRTPYRSSLTVLISISLIFSVYLIGITHYNRIVILLIFSGIFSLCAVDKFEHRKLLGDRKSFKVMGQRWIIPITSFILCLLISGSTLAIFDNDKTYGFRNKTCSGIAADVQSYTGIYTKEQRDLSISLYDLGLQDNEKYIGGNLPKREHVLLATTDLNKSYNVRVTTFDIFTGKNWITSFENNYRINGPFKEKQTQYLANNSLNRSDSLFNLKNFVFRKKVNIILDIDTLFLPTIGQTYKYTENSESINPNLFNNSGQIFSYFGQSDGYSYTLDTIHFNTNAKLSKKDASVLNKISSKPDPIYTKSFVKRYTQSSANFDSNINNLFKSLGINPKNSYDTACKITGFFSKKNGFTYSTKGLDFDDSSNVINEIFKTKKGHCVYYSTTAIALLRYLKVPCRLAAGFRTVQISNNIQIIDSYYPYCWVECYFPNLGWISFDPSPENEIRFDAEIPSFSSKPSKPKGEQKPSEPEENITDIKENKKFNFISVIILLAIALAYLISRGFWSNKLYDYKFVSKRFDTTEKQCKYYLKDIQRQFNILGFKKHPEKTLREQTAQIKEILEDNDKSILISAIEICEAFCYGGNIPNKEEVLQVYKARSVLDNTIRSRINPIIYIVKRRILLPIL